MIVKLQKMAKGLKFQIQKLVNSVSGLVDI